MINRIFAVIGIIALLSSQAIARENASIAGSATVLPFAKIVAKRLGGNTSFKTPIVEPGGSSIGKKSHVMEREITNKTSLSGNAKKLESLAMNLVSNAVSHTPERALTWILLRTTDDKAIFSGKDSGDGILQEQLPRLTQRFYRVDSVRSRNTCGSGLGLVFVKHLLERRNTSLSIKSVPERESYFPCIPHWIAS